MRRIAHIGLVCCFTLSACSLGSGGNARSSCAEDYWDGELGACLPDAWVVVDAETMMQRGVPPETLVAFQAEEAVSGQFPTVVVTREALGQEVASGDYSSAAMRSVSVLSGYNLIDARSVRIDGSKVDVHIFSAQPSEAEPRRRFYQMSFSEGLRGYTVTATTPVAIEDSLEASIFAIFEGFTLVDPESKKS
ncbi:hypothetical protein FJZ27_03845 [Candidatus Peribacteria bacterium]|nr:hypothetical protein [Candidatus Peribacteria bacterium]